METCVYVFLLYWDTQVIQIAMNSSAVSSVIFFFFIPHEHETISAANRHMLILTGGVNVGETYTGIRAWGSRSVVREQ